MSFMQKIFSVTNENKKRKIINILGIKIKLKRKLKLEDIESLINSTQVRIIQRVQRSINTALLHQKTFLPFKNYYQGKNVVLIGAGPSVNDFVPLDNAIYIGCNRAFLFEKIKFDYLFSIDKVGIDQYYEDFFKYEGNSCIKFLGDQNNGIDFQIPESYILKFPKDKIKRYKTVMGYLPDKFELDIDSMPLANGASVALQAMQFILYTNPQKVYVVGIDCTVAQNRHFVGISYNNENRNESAKFCDDYNVKMWKELKKFAQIYYPETQIISINPVGLKGIFTDIYTNDNHEYVNDKGEKYV